MKAYFCISKFVARVVYGQTTEMQAHNFSQANQSYAYNWLDNKNTKQFIAGSITILTALLIKVIWSLSFIASLDIHKC